MVFGREIRQGGKGKDKGGNLGEIQDVA